MLDFGLCSIRATFSLQAWASDFFYGFVQLAVIMQGAAEVTEAFPRKLTYPFYDSMTR